MLLLCFTAPLRRWLEARLAGAAVDVRTVSGLAKQLADAAEGRGRVPIAQPDGWREAFLRAAEACEPRWDAVVVDEAQDLQPEAWALVARLAAGRRLWAFHDPAQGYWPDRHPPRELFGAVYRLPRQQRSPPGVIALAALALGHPHDAAALAAARADGIVALAPCAPGAAAEAAGAEVDALLASGLTPGEIGVVSLRGVGGGAAGAGPQRYGAHEAVRADALDMEGRLVADTFLRWKGLERAAIVVVDLPEEPLPQLGVRLHVALTRATVAVRLVGTAAALERLAGSAVPG